MRQVVRRLLGNPVIRHLIRAGDRFGERNGPLLAAAVTYYSVLSLVPILVAVVSVAGMALTSFWPDSVQQAKITLFGRLGTSIIDQLSPAIDQIRSSFGNVVIVSLGLALWAGSVWIRSLRRAIVAQVVPDPNEPGPRRNMVLEILVNMGTFVVLVVLTIATFAVTTLSISFNAHLVRWFGLSDAVLISLFVGLVALLVTAFAGTVLFLYLFWVLSGRKLPTREWLIGSVGAGLALTLLQSLAGIVTGMLSRNVTARIFGPVIVIMLFFNLYATLIMYVASWIGTSESSRIAPAEQPIPESSKTLDPVVVRLAPWPKKARGLAFTRDGELDVDSIPRPDPTVVIPQDVAARGVKVGTAIGYGVGAVSGIGIGIVMGAVKGKVSRRT